MSCQQINGFLENRQMKESLVHSCTTSISAPPSSIWNGSNVCKVPSSSLKNDKMKLQTITENGTRANTPPGKSGYSRIPLAQTNSTSGCGKNEGAKNRKEETENLIKQCNSKSVGLKQEKAAITIQRAYRTYKRNCNLVRSRSNFQNRRSSDVPDSSVNERNSRSNKDQFRGSAPVVMERLNLNYYPRNSAFKDYLRNGSLFFPDRESVVVFGGIDPHSKYGDGRNTGRNIFRYHSETNRWDLVGELPRPRHHHAVAFFRGKIYLAGGADPRDDPKGKSVVVGSVWSFEPVTRAWRKESEMITPRKNFGLVVINGKLLAIGGVDKNGRVLSSVERYDAIAGVWENVAPLNVGRTGAAVSKFGDSVWVAGGMTNSKKLSSSVESYDAKRDKWIEEAPLRFPRCFSCLFTMNDTLYLIGGAGRVSEKDKRVSSCNAMDVWNPKEREWKLHFAMSIPRHGHAAAYLGTQILIVGGVTTAYSRALADVECFCCERKTWVRGLAGLPVPLSGHGAATLPPASLM